jgi:diguanylate cyclase (GGDEF)-like protein
MNNLEEEKLMQLKGEIFENLQINQENYSDNGYVQTLVDVIRKVLEIEHIHFLISKELYKDIQYIVKVKHRYISIIDPYNPMDQQYCESLIQSNEYNKKIILNTAKEELIGYIFLKIEIDSFSSQFWDDFTHIIHHYFKQVFQILVINNEKRRYRLLQSVTNQLHSSIDIDAVLRKVLESLKEIYPNFYFTLQLSTDDFKKSDLSIETLDYTMENSPAMECFLTGNYRIEDDINRKESFMYFPLKGKQGIYGVLHIHANQSIIISEQDIEFIHILAQTAGNAMENARLYQHSKQLIKDLKLITNVSKKLNSILKLTDLVKYIVAELKNSFNAHEAGIVMFKEEYCEVLSGSTTYFYNEDCKSLLHEVKQVLLTKKEGLFLGDVNQSQYRFTSIPYASIMVESIEQDDNIIGSIIVLHQQPYYFSFETFKLFRSLTQHSSLAFSNAILREELEQLVITDYLTKLYTRNYLDDEMKQSMERDTQGVFLLIDIDNFKKVNDTYGHQNGDKVLVQIADIIKEKLITGGIAARWGGEEIAVYLPNYTFEEGMHLAHEFVQLIPKKSKPSVTISCGVSYWSIHQPESPLTLFKKADEALYEAKNTGKNRMIANI